MRIWIFVLAAVLGACAKFGTMRFGTAVPTDELHAHRADLRGWIAKELAAGRHDRAFYALEVLKTRRYAGQRLVRASARDRSTSDLRPLFTSVFAPVEAGDTEPLVATRGLTRTAQHATTFTPQHAVEDELYWADLRLFEHRIEDVIWYSHALRYSFAAITTTEARGIVGPRDAAVSFFLDGDTVHAFVIRSSGVIATQLGAPARELRVLAATFLDQLRKRDPAWEATSARLHDLLLAPLGLSAIDRLYVIPDGFLSNVPFGLLAEPTGGRRTVLFDRIGVGFLPSATVYRRLTMGQELNEPPRMLAVGNPEFSVPVARLEAAEVEARVVSSLFDESTLFTGGAATEGAILKQVERANILHFATHGVLLGDQVAGASSLLLAADDPRDGFLSAAEIAGLDLSRTYLAVLSACETGVSADGTESLDVGSLVGAFMAAGAPTVVGSLWQVSDDSTTELLVAFYREFLERGAGEALRRAQLAVRAMPGFEHPYYWGGFVLYGWDK